MRWELMLSRGFLDFKANSYGYGYFMFDIKKKKSNNPTFILPPCSISPEDISIVIPVKNNQKGIDTFLRDFYKNTAAEYYPKEIIIVDNNSIEPVYIKEELLNSQMPIKVFKCDNVGPSAARNIGIKETKSKWILFTDSDCIPTEKFVSAYIRDANTSIALMGNVKSYSSKTIPEYYDTQHIFNPPLKNNSPDYLITSNVLILKEAIILAGSFDEKFGNYGCEDIELSLRLKEYGDFLFVKESIVLHKTGSNIVSFVLRFIKYGKGLKVLGIKQNIGIKLSFPNSRTLVNILLYFLHHISLYFGYKTAKI